MKKTYWKVVCDEYPLGLVFTDRIDALLDAKELREYYSEKAYVRAIKLTEEEYNKIPEA